jgi:hypothetical protein
MPNRALPHALKAEALRRLLEGEDEEQIARSGLMSLGSVSNVKKEFIEFAEDYGLV